MSAKRYCGMCDEWVRGMECPKCGADTDKAEPPPKAVDLMDALRRALPPDLYQWRVGDVFTKGTSRWVVDEVRGDGKAVLRSCGSPWATTIPLTVAEWHENGRWQLEPKVPT